MIAVTFNTRSLKKQFENLITTFVLEQANEEPDWDKIRILNAWGAPGGSDRTGIYFEFCRDHGVEYLDFGTAKNRYGSDKAFEGACETALQGVKTFAPKYDAILVDEAQDFAPNFLLLCYEYLKSPKRLVYAYDELQNLRESIAPPVEEIFGKNGDGTPRVVINPPETGKPKQDIILDTCYRNSRPVLSTAHALGFGVYRTKGLVQIFENKNLWFDIGYQEENDGDIEDGEPVALSRTAKSSPEFLEKHSPVDDLIRFEVFETADDKPLGSSQEIKRNLTEDELIPDDIVVINPDPLRTKERRRRKQDADADGNQLEPCGCDDNRRCFHRARNCDVYWHLPRKRERGCDGLRNQCPRLFWSISSRGMSHASATACLQQSHARKLGSASSGVGKAMAALKAEFERAKGREILLRFVYPTEEERKHIMMTVNRDMSKAEQDRSNKRRTNFAEIIGSLDRERALSRTIRKS